MGGAERAGLERDCMHVAASDTPFRARMRFHQSWYRRHVLGLPPGPGARGQTYGNMLWPEDGLRGYNFVSDAVYRHAEARLAQSVGVVEPGRLRNNLLSSQPMCFNVFAPLALDTRLATRLVSPLPGIGQGVEVEEVLLEYAPPRANHLDDNSAFDAWIRYRRGAVRGFIGIETKLTEPFSQQGYAADRPGYARWLTADADGWWRPGAAQHFANPQFNQLWRNHLLAFAMLRQPVPDFDEGYVAVVSHPADAACGAAVAAYREHLGDGGNATFLSWRLDDLVGRWRNASVGRDENDWLSALRLRYLDLEASEPAWRLFNGQAA